LHIFQGKTGLDLPNIHIGPLELDVMACHTGPDGGLTRVQPMRQRAIAKMAKLDDEEFSLSSMDEAEEGEGEEKNDRRNETEIAKCRAVENGHGKEAVDDSKMQGKN
jgi:hypothetical protein